jgi:hypothetical protein
VEYFPAFKNLAILPTGNCSPALVDRDMAFFPELFPLPDMVTDTRNFLFSPKPEYTGGKEWGTKKCATTPMKTATKKHDLEDFRDDADPQRNQGRRKQSRRAQPSPQQEHILNWQQKSQPIACLHADRQ